MAASVEESSANCGPPGPVQVRKAVPDDAPAIAAVHVASWQTAYEGLLPGEFLAGLSVESRARHWEATIAACSRDHLMVVEVGDAVAGFAHAGPSRDEDPGPATGELYMLYLAPHAWGLGMGRALHDRVLEQLAADGCSKATLWYLGTNRRARAFYERQGWAQTDGVRTQEFGGQVVTDYRLGRSLTTR